MILHGLALFCLHVLYFFRSEFTGQTPTKTTLTIIYRNLIVLVSMSFCMRVLKNLSEDFEWHY